MKVRNVLAFLAALKGVPKAEIPGRLESWLKAMDLSSWQQKEVRELSRGMQRRLEFVAAVISDPDLIVMDEPFAGLDPVNLDLVRDTILRLRAAGKTIILSTHLMEQAETLCDRILLIHRGRKVLDGSLDEIRAPYESDAVVVELEGESGFIESLPMVRGVTRAQLWGYMAAQEFTAVSPAMHEEFLLRYQLPILKQFGLVAYGCCEDLTKKIDMLRQLKNLRDIAVTPVANGDRRETRSALYFSQRSTSGTLCVMTTFGIPTPLGRTSEQPEGRDANPV